MKAINPLIYEKTSEGEEMYDIFSRLLKERILFIGEDIMPDLANCIVSQLLFLDKQSEEEPIHIYINSDGGDLSSMFAIYDIMQFVKAPIYTYVLGTAASAAAVLLAAGNKGCRIALPNSEIMMHQPIGGVSGQITDITLTSKQMERSKRKMITILARHTGKTYECVERDCDRDYWMNPTMAIKYGIIDEVSKVNKQLPEVLHEVRRGRPKRQ
jgi:ATP-dependent Clp protease protease subunit